MIDVAPGELKRVATDAVKREPFLEYAKKYLAFKNQETTQVVLAARNQVKEPIFTFRVNAGLKMFKVRISQDSTKVVVDLVLSNNQFITSVATFPFKDVMTNGELLALGLTTKPKAAPKKAKSTTSTSTKKTTTKAKATDTKEAAK